MTKSSSDDHIETRIFSLIAKFGFPIVIAVLLLAWIFLFFLPKHEDTIKLQTDMCLQNMRDLGSSFKKMEENLTQIQIKIEASPLCKKDKK